MSAAVHFSPQIPVLQTATSSPSLNRRQPLLGRRSGRFMSEGAGEVPSPRGCNGARFGEVCGGTTAECAAVCCCCPCGLMNLLVLAVYKLPAGLCRRALRRRRRRRLIKHGLFPSSRRSSRCHCGCDEGELQVHPIGGVEGFDYGTMTDDKADESEANEAVLALEREMWNTFYSTGFWRSPSQRETTPSPKAKTAYTKSPSPWETPVSPVSRSSLLKSASQRESPLARAVVHL